MFSVRIFLLGEASQKFGYSRHMAAFEELPN